MTPLDNAINARLASDGTLTALLATFKGTPAIFLSTPLPQGVVPPYVAVPPIVTQSPNDTKTSEGRSLIRDIGCYTLATGSTVTVDAIAERVRSLFHRHPLAITGFATMIAMAAGPSLAPTDKTLYGRIVSVNLTIWKT